MKRMLSCLLLVAASGGCATLDVRAKGISGVAYDKELDKLYVVDDGSLLVCSKSNAGKKLNCDDVELKTE